MTSQSINCDCKYKEAFNNNHTPMMIVDTKTGDIDDVNLAACNYYSYSREKMLHMNIKDINILDKEEIIKEMDKAKLEDRKYFRFKHKLSNGEIRDVEVYSGPMKIKNKELLFSVIHDTKEKDKIMKNYMINKVYFNSLFENSPEAIAIVDKDFNILNINESFEKVFQYNKEEINGADITKILCEEKLYDTSYYFRESISKGKFVKEEVRRKRKNGSVVDVLLLGFPLVVEDRTIGAYCIYSDISEAKEKEKQIQLLTSNDILTGLYNRDFFLENIDYEIHKSRFEENNKEKFAVLFLDINEFKEINDALGHKTGDQVLKQFTLRLSTSLEKKDIISRFGEEEFAILIPRVESLNQIEEILRKITQKIDSPFIINNYEFKITISIGIAIYPDDGTESATLARKAEIAMNKSKKLNSNQATRFENSLDKEVQEYFWMKNNLVKAILDEDLFLNYQPIYDACTNKLMGVEALLRWKHKEKGIIPPTKFIPIAEKSGMIHPIGEWVLLNACMQNRKWQELGYKPIYISVNVSVLQLEQSNFCEIIQRVLKESMLDPRYLQLEVTETYFTQSYESIEKNIKEISKLGIKLAIDDFGTGYSSLGQLCEININNLKIDRSFIDGVEMNVNKSKIVKAVITLAESLNISLTAEGVETQEQLNFLKNNRCTSVQGYLFSKPVETIEIESLLTK